LPIKLSFWGTLSSSKGTEPSSDTRNMLR
jgi:hypothetical protein